MLTNITPSKASAGRALDDRFKDARSTIDANSFQLDESYEDNSDPYNSTGRFLATAIKNLERE